MFDKELLKLDGMAQVFAASFISAVLRSLLIVCQALSLSAAVVGLWGASGEFAEAMDRQLPMLAAFAACYISRKAVEVVCDSVVSNAAHRSVARLRADLIAAYFDSGSAVNATWGSAAFVSEAIDGVQKIEDYVTAIVPKTVDMVVVPLAICMAVFVQDWVSGVIVLVCYPFIIIFMRLIGYTASDESAKRRRSFEAMSNHFLDSLRGMRTLRSFGISRQYSESVFAASEAYRKLIMRTLRIAQLSGAVLDLFATCGLAAVAIMLGFRMVEGSLAFMPALTVLMLVPEYFLPIRAFAADYHASLDGKTALSSVLGMIGTERRFARLGGVHVNVAQGQVAILAGRSGVGKTTLLDIVAGSVDSEEADVVVCGVGCDGFRDGEWRKKVAYIPQRPCIIDGTVRDNAALYRKDAEDGEVLAALKAAGLGELIEELPEGLDTRVGPSHRALSGGQAHRLAIARALVDTSRSVWLIDEPGSSLDEQTELELKESLLGLVRGRGKTAILATHRRHWLEDGDVVVDFDAMSQAQGADSSRKTS